VNAPEDRSKALNEHMSSGFAPRADIVAAFRHVRFVPEPAVSRCNKVRVKRVLTQSPRRRDHLSISCVAWPLYKLTPGNALTFQALHAINFGLRFGGIKLGECVL